MSGSFYKWLVGNLKFNQLLKIASKHKIYFRVKKGFAIYLTTK